MVLTCPNRMTGSYRRSAKVLNTTDGSVAVEGHRVQVFPEDRPHQATWETEDILSEPQSIAEHHGHQDGDMHPFGFCSSRLERTPQAPHLTGFPRGLSSGR